MSYKQEKRRSELCMLRNSSCGHYSKRPRPQLIQLITNISKRWSKWDWQRLNCSMRYRHGLPCRASLMNCRSEGVGSKKVTSLKFWRVSRSERLAIPWFKMWTTDANGTVTIWSSISRNNLQKNGNLYSKSITISALLKSSNSKIA